MDVVGLMVKKNVYQVINLVHLQLKLMKYQVGFIIIVLQLKKVTHVQMKSLKDLAKMFTAIKLNLKRIASKNVNNVVILKHVLIKIKIVKHGMNLNVLMEKLYLIIKIKIE